MYATFYISSDHSLHQPAIKEGIVIDLLKLKLKPNWTQGVEEESVDGDHQWPEGGGSEGVTVDPRGFLKPCVQCLQLLVQTSSEVRGQLACDVTFLKDLFKGN